VYIAATFVATSHIYLYAIRAGQKSNPPFPLLPGFPEFWQVGAVHQSMNSF
jgi:hypothetical protein